MEFDKSGHWRTLQFLRSKHRLFIASLDNYRLAAAQTNSSQKRGLPAEVRKLLHHCGKDWDDAEEALKEASERQAIMHLFVCFERIIRVDGQLRGEQPAHQHHPSFVKAASAAPSYVRFEQWLQCWVNAAIASKHRTSRVTLRQLKQQFKDERNPMMHNDQASLPPLSLVARRLQASLAAVQDLASDFPLQR